MSSTSVEEDTSQQFRAKFPKIDHCRLIGPACIIGGALTHLTLGTLYCWGNFISYSPLNLRFFDGKFRPGVPSDSLYVPALTLLAQTLVMPFAPVLFQKLGARNMLLIGSWLTALSVYLASFQTSLSTFMLAYSLLFGIGLGSAYTAPMYACWKWLPKKKGFVSGGVLAGFGAGGFIFSMIGSKLANPKGLPMVNGLFPDEVYQNFPSMLRSLALLYAILSLIGSIFVLEPAGPFKKISFFAGTSDCPVEYNTTDSKGVTIWQALKTWQFWLMWLMIISSASAGLNTAVIYKQFADSSSMLSGDQYQALVGGIGAIFNGAGRVFWGNVADKIGFKTAFTVLTLFQTVMMFTYNFSASSKILFALNTSALFFCLAGNFSLIPSAVQRMFGPKQGPTIFGAIFSAFAISSILGGMLTKALVRSFGYKTLFSIMAVMSLLATVMVSVLRPTTTYADSSV